MAVPWETIAVVLSVAYLLLAARARIECWYAAAASVLIYFFILLDVRLYMEAGLQVFYLAMAGYGFSHWRRGGETAGAAARIITWRWSAHAAALSGIAAASLISGWLLHRYTDAAYPYLDAFTTCGALVATVMVARKVLENWLYWVVIDAAAIFLFLARDLEQTAALFALYTVLAAYGFFDWQRRWRRQDAITAG
ncbi:MAG: nicotinamide riboside transporter PnuC [Pseudomonadales bacterium]